MIMGPRSGSRSKGDKQSDRNAAQTGGRTSVKRPTGSLVLRYVVLGVSFGLLLPLIALILHASEAGMPFGLTSIAAAHQRMLQWVIDTAPLFLGIAAYIAGRRQQQVLQLNQRLNENAQERDQLVSQLENVSSNLRREVEENINHLRTAAQIAQQANTVRDLPQLLDQAAHVIADRFGFYHVGIFLNEHERGGTGLDYAVLKAASSAGGQKMLNRGHKLPIGQVGIVGYVAAHGTPKIALDVGNDAVFFGNPDLPLTRSEIALPLKIAHQVIGVLDIQTSAPAAFDEGDTTVMQIIADSLASAIQNARLFAQVSENLDEIRVLHRHYVEQAWSDIGTTTPESGLQFDYHTGGGPSLGLSRPDGAAASSSVPGAEIDRGKDASGQMLSVTTPGEAEDASESAVPRVGSSSFEVPRRVLQVPIRLREQVIGSLTLEGISETPLAVRAAGETGSGSDGTQPGAPDGEWTPQEMVLIQTVTNEAALALENARLLDETRHRAERERMSVGIASRVWAFSDVDMVLRTALTELGSALEASDGWIELEVGE